MSEFDKFDCFIVRKRGRISQIEINRPKKVNSFNSKAWNQYYELIKYLNNETDTKVIILNGIGKHLSAGIDINEIKYTRNITPDYIKQFQKCINAPIEFDIPVISVSHGVSYGLAIDIISATTIRIASKDVRFSIKEIDVGIMADIGSLQRLSTIMGNISKLNELALTGVQFGAEDALRFGLISEISENKEEGIKRAFEIAELIADKFDGAVIGTKRHIETMTNGNFLVQKGLDKVALDNSILMNSSEYHGFLRKKFGVKL